MLSKRIIACLDIRDGRVVKGVRFENLRDAGDPAARAALYEAQGADEIVLLDVSATAEGRAACLRTVQEVREVLSIPLTVGGGVRGEDDAQALLEAGADKVAVNTAAFENRSLLPALSKRFGAQCAVLALDAAANDALASGYEVVVRSGKTRTGSDALVWAREAVVAGAGEIVLTSLDRDGTKEGYDCRLLSLVSASVPVPVVASGGAGSIDDVAAALSAGAEAALAASLFHYDETTIGEVKRFLADRGFAVRR